MKMIRTKKIICIIFGIIGVTTCRKIFPEDARLNFTQFSDKYDMSCKEHQVITEDGYILKLFHVPGDSSNVVFLMHGLADSADTFVIRGRTSLVKRLNERGYDVWIGNFRGNRYGRRHKILDPDLDPQFWEYSLHENALYDLKAQLDYTLTTTGQENLIAIGHSQGNAVFYALCSVNPEYNNKIKLLVALAPIAFLTHLKPPVTTLMDLARFNGMLKMLRQNEILGDQWLPKKVFQSLCTKQTKTTYQICANGVIFALCGNDPDGLEEEFLPVVIMHFPDGTSRKSLMHLVQIHNRKRFAMYDYGATYNLEFYNQTFPPHYNLRKVTMDVALYAGRGDQFSEIKDVEELRRNLPNVVEYRVMKPVKWNHLDPIWGRHMDKFLYPYLFQLLAKYK